MTAPHIKIYSQVEDPEDDSEDGVVIAFGVFQQDRLVRCWVMAQDEDELRSCDKLTIDALGVTQVAHHNLSSDVVTHDDPEMLEVMLQVLRDGGNYVAIDPARFRHVRG